MYKAIFKAIYRGFDLELQFCLEFVGGDSYEFCHGIHHHQSTISDNIFGFFPKHLKQIQGYSMEEPEFFLFLACYHKIDQLNHAPIVSKYAMVHGGFLAHPDCWRCKSLTELPKKVISQHLPSTQNKWGI